MIIRKRIPISYMEDEIGSLVLVGVQGNDSIDVHFKMSTSSRSILEHVNTLWESIVLSLKELGIKEVYTCVPFDSSTTSMMKFWGWMGFGDLREYEGHYYASRRL